MKISRILGCLCVALLSVSFVGISSTTAGTIDVAQSSWSASQVVLRITGVPVGKMVTVCVFKDNGCEIRAQVRSAAAGGDGVVNLIVPKQGSDFLAGDKVRASDIACATLVSGVTLILVSCEVVCIQCIDDMVSVPSLTQWGMIVLGILILAAGAMVIVRRRRAVVQA